ncbi:hypothetical protein KY349_02285 [Candidatus Woesearchaeota archaeon]|nr:hypothetical protein [Candidatus Woesearchaeota archaeon]
MKQPKRCHKCIRRSAYKLVDKWYCGKCFCQLVEQKIRRHLRRYRIKKDSKLLVTDKASEYMLKRVVNVPVEIVKKKQSTGFLVLPWTLDDENEEFLKMFLKNKRIVTKENKKVIKLFYPVSKKDMKIYFLTKKVTYRPVKTEINQMIDILENKYPGTKTGLLKSEERLKKIL